MFLEIQFRADAPFSFEPFIAFVEYTLAPFRALRRRTRRHTTCIVTAKDHTEDSIVAMIPSRQSISNAAEMLFERVYFRAWVRQLWGRLVGEPCELQFLDVTMEVQDFSKVEKTVPLDAICGTTGRADRFDCQFRPRQRRDKGRWTSVAIAMMRDPLALGRVSLIQVGADYYVADGHHRVSVARALDKIGIDAVVTIWDTAGETTDHAADMQQERR